MSTDSNLDPAADLEAEHRVIQKAVAGLTYLGTQIEAGEPVDPELLIRAVEFLRSYADRRHHGKEEALFFPALEARGVPHRGCPVGVLLHEHTHGRELVGEFAEAIDQYAAGGQDAGQRLSTVMGKLSELYPHHIWKEDYLLFPLSKKVLTESDVAKLSEQFAEVNRQMSAADLAKFEALAEELSSLVTDVQ